MLSEHHNKFPYDSKLLKLYIVQHEFDLSQYIIMLSYDIMTPLYIICIELDILYLSN